MPSSRTPSTPFDMKFHYQGLASVSDTAELERLAGGFSLSRRGGSPLYRCVGALDGICVRVKKPLGKCKPRDYFCRKGFYSVPVQAIVDSSYRFLYMSARCVGSTHDSLAWAQEKHLAPLLPYYQWYPFRCEARTRCTQKKSTFRINHFVLSA